MHFKNPNKGNNSIFIHWVYSQMQFKKPSTMEATHYLYNEYIHKYNVRTY